jgi:FAD/FMN-containing dehydrogenase
MNKWRDIGPHQPRHPQPKTPKPPKPTPLSQKVYHPETVEDVRWLIQQAKQQKKNLRPVGHTHSWSPILMDSNDIVLVFDKMLGACVGAVAAAPQCIYAVLICLLGYACVCVYA